MDVNNLPEPYADCVIQHEDGSKRIGRLHYGKQYFELASYQNRKDYVVWPIEKVINFKLIDFEINEVVNYANSN
jgi:hypothetical protein